MHSPHATANLIVQLDKGLQGVFMKIALIVFAFLLSLVASEFVLIASAFAQSGAPTGTLINPSSPNGVESNPTTFENVQPVLGSTPPPVKHPKFRRKVKGGNVQSEQKSFVSPPDTMEKETTPAEPKESH
jgi:hypothetical protein